MKKAVILLNMGGARSKEELREFLKNMFLDRRIISSPIRFVLSPLITALRLDEAWKNYEIIGGSKIYDHTQKLVDKLNKRLCGKCDVLFAMRYTAPKIAEVLRGKEYDEVVLFPLYPHFSSTTTLSSFDDADKFFGAQKTKVLKVEYFFDDSAFNETIVSSIKKHYKSGAHLVFSAHSLPLSIAKNDLYEAHIKEHIGILTKMLSLNGLEFGGIHLAFQSKLGPVKWLEPSIGDVLRSLSGEDVIVYPISFTIDNSETDFELSCQYREYAQKSGVKSYEVCAAQNDSDSFAEFISQKIEKLIR